MEILQYSYMVKALIVGFVISIIIPFMGIVVVNKKMSVVGDALSHVALSGVIIGLITSYSPVLMSIITCLIAALLIEFIRKRFPSYQEMATAIIMSTGIGLASILSGFVKVSANFESFLFGSIIAITDLEFYTIICIGIIVFFTFVFLYRDLMHISFDETSARLCGVNINRVNVIFMVLMAITISVSARTVGILIISSIMVVPVACAMRFQVGYLKTIIYSVLFGIFFTISGLVISFYVGLKPGGTIVLIGVLTLITLLIVQNGKN